MIKLFVANNQLRQDKLLVIAPHPDDEIIGLGGLLLQQVQAGGEVHLLYLTDGEASGTYADSHEIKQQRIALTNGVCEELGIKPTNIHRLHLPDGAVPHRGDEGFDSSASAITVMIDRIQPDAVFSTAATDYWPYDHVACSELAIEAVKSAKHKPALWFYWVWAWYNLHPKSLFKLNFRNLYKIDITEQLSAKKALMDMYLKPLSPEGKPWSGELPEAMLYPFSKPVEVLERIL